MIGLVAEQYNVAAGLSIIFFLAVIAAIIAWRNEYLINRNSRAPEVNYQDQLF